MLRVGLTGGIGSGKSVVSSLFAAIGIPVFDSDSIAKSLYTEDKAVKELVIRNFGNDLYKNDTFNRAKMAEIVFADHNKLSILNQIIHPVVRDKYFTWTAINDHFPYTIHEAAILFESGANLFMDKIIFVSASEDTRIKRVMKRDGVSREMVLNRIKQQDDDNKKCNLSDFVIMNDLNIENLSVQVYEIHEKLLNLANILS